MTTTTNETTRRRDQAFRDQPMLFGEETDIIDHGRISRNETYREIVETLTEKRMAWLKIIAAKGEHGATLDELSIDHETAVNKFSGRITELKKSGLVVRRGEKRATSSGSTAAVIVATDRGRRLLRSLIQESGGVSE